METLSHATLKDADEFRVPVGLSRVISHYL